VKQAADSADRNNLLVTSRLTINGTLHVKGDFEAKSTVYMKPGSQLIVDGKRTIHGSLKEVKE
jgi:hypothetical protein